MIPTPLISRRLPLLALAALALTAHGQALFAALQVDDLEIATGARLRPGSAMAWMELLVSEWWQSGHDRLWRPLTLFSLALQVAAGGEAFSFHAVNLILHAVCAVLLASVFMQATGSEPAGWVAGALFAVHPLGSEAVTLVVGRADLLAALFLSAGALAALLHLESGARRWLGMVAALTLAACLSKESGVVLPGLVVVLCLAHGACRRRIAGGEAHRPGRVMALVAVSASVVLSYVLLRWAVLGELLGAQPLFVNNPLAHSGPVTARITGIELLGRALRQFAWPGRLSVDWSHAATGVSPLSTARVALLVAAMAVAAGVIARLRRRPVALTGLAFFLAAHALTANIVVIIGTAYAERLLYLPMAGLCLVAGDAVSWSGEGGGKGRRRAVLVVGLLVVGALFARTQFREHLFRDQLTLWRATATAVPRSAKAHYNLGNHLARAGRSAEAEEEFRTAVSIFPSAAALSNLGLMRLQAGDPAGALDHLDRAVRLDPGSPFAAANRALALERLGRTEEARQERLRARHLGPPRSGVAGENRDLY